jgi:hypothetical protein
MLVAFPAWRLEGAGTRELPSLLARSRFLKRRQSMMAKGRRTSMLSQQNLSKLRRDVSALITRWKQAGRPVGVWRCPHCHDTQEATLPSGGDPWTSLTTCTQCGRITHTTRHASGKIELLVLSDAGEAIPA